MTAKDTLRAIIELEELKKDTATTRSVLCSAQKVLEADELGDEHVTELMTAVREKYSSMIQSVQRYRAAATRRERLWVMFHVFSTDEGRALCDTCDKNLNLAAPDIFWQLWMEKEFITMISQQEASHSSATDLSISSPRKLTYVEENAVRYTAGYVIRKLESKYSRLTTEEASECCTALREMGGKLITSEHQSSDWTKLTDRGGLYHVENIGYELFVTIELIVDKELSAVFEAKGKGLEKEKLSWVCCDEDVQFLWCMISPATIEEERVRQQLLQELVFLWITTRGHSKAGRIKEDYKRAKGKSVKGKHSLRKDSVQSEQ